MKSEDEIPRGRRDFFKEAFGRLIQPVATYLEEQIGISIPSDKPLLRPPGALPEAQFLATCQRCGDCIESCPAEAILPLQSHQANLAQTPYIDPNTQPCVVCESLACMKACPTGALQEVPRGDIQIGLAEVNYDTCLRTQEIECTYCVDSCPIGKSAIRLDAQQRVLVLANGCVGCGVCQHQCPTVPKSITVQLRANH